MDSIFTTCEHCAERFEAPTRSAGGLTNCPRCGQATEVSGGSDPLWTALVGLALAVTVVAVTIAYQAGGGPAAAMTFGVCALIATIQRLAA
ncbi:hypothetical protein Poly30_37370 [Planctomycetes bacterium Poly30]|uniref:Uncharacterized protein n=1 Tax=Saltatorellus ferox TaxID=2528018 RepID=A0A518EVS8_9BACT|nr:hypothetical protein Poly30_37370 [Planctomycetes bacterium Poly30]